jgi:hypothetical protein
MGFVLVVMNCLILLLQIAVQTIYMESALALFNVVTYADHISFFKM